MLTVGGRVISELQVGMGIGALLTLAAVWLVVLLALAIIKVRP